MIKKRISSDLLWAKPNGSEWILLGKALINERKKKGFTQTYLAERLGLERTKLVRFEKVAKWSKRAQSYINSDPVLFDFSMMNRLVRRKWSDQRSLCNEIIRIIDGQRHRKRYTKKSREQKIDPNTIRIEDRLRASLGTKAVLTKDTIELYHFGNLDVLEGMLDKISGKTY